MHDEVEPIDAHGRMRGVKSPAELVGELDHGTWSFDGKSLTFHPVKKGRDADAYAILGSHPWRKVG